MKSRKSDALVLNKHWIPIHIVDVKQAFRQLFNGSANAIHPDTYEVHSLESWLEAPVDKENLVMGVGYFQHGNAKIPVLVPHILVLTRYNRLPDRVVKYSRNGIFERDRYTCQYCGVSYGGKKKDRNGDWLLNIDHVVPRAKKNGFQGTNFMNCVTSCVPCNSQKGGRTPEEAGMKLLREPFIPKWKSFRGVAVSHPSWKTFLKGEQL